MLADDGQRVVLRPAELLEEQVDALDQLVGVGGRLAVGFVEALVLDGLADADAIDNLPSWPWRLGGEDGYLLADPSLGFCAVHEPDGVRVRHVQYEFLFDFL